MGDLRREAPAEPTFEEAYGELEATVQKLEEGGLTLDELLTLFERGMTLVRVCGSRLDAAELRVSRLVARPDGEAGLSPFEG
jgi:exodeoxyribonuclease VII small subunit